MTAFNLPLLIIATIIDRHYCIDVELNTSRFSVAFTSIIIVIIIPVIVIVIIIVIWQENVFNKYPVRFNNVI